MKNEQYAVCPYHGRQLKYINVILTHTGIDGDIDEGKSGDVSWNIVCYHTL